MWISAAYRGRGCVPGEDCEHEQASLMFIFTARDQWRPRPNPDTGGCD